MLRFAFSQSALFSDSHVVHFFIFKMDIKTICSIVY